MSRYDYDLYVIGGGSGGVRAARLTANLGLRVGLAEEFVALRTKICSRTP